MNVSQRQETVVAQIPPTEIRDFEELLERDGIQIIFSDLNEGQLQKLSQESFPTLLLRLGPPLFTSTHNTEPSVSSLSPHIFLPNAGIPSFPPKANSSQFYHNLKALIILSDPSTIRTFEDEDAIKKKDAKDWATGLPAVTSSLGHVFLSLIHI